MVAEISDKLRETLPALKQAVLTAIEQDYNVPTLVATLEYVKYIGSDRLVSAQFQESLLDAFGAHGYDRWDVEGEDPGKTKKGAQHYDWLPT
jgi:6-phosphogluconate dehydrogenase